MAHRRTELRFTNYRDIIHDIERLQESGYEMTGKWNLGQICRHLSFYWKGSLDGFTVQLPWIIRATLGRLILKSSLKETIRKPGGQTAPQSVFAAEPDDKEAVAEAIALLQRLDQNTAKLHPSALFGEVTNDQWKTLHCNHAGHHLSFLAPKGG